MYLWCISIYIVYLNVSIVYFNVFLIYFNIFYDIVIVMTPLHFHYNLSAMRTHLHICFLLSTMIPFQTSSTTTLFSLISIGRFKLLFKSIIYQCFTLHVCTLSHIPHSYWLHGAQWSPSFFNIFISL
jgi:hypothetical protein